MPEAAPYFGTMTDIQTSSCPPRQHNRSLATPASQSVRPTARRSPKPGAWLTAGLMTLAGVSGAKADTRSSEAVQDAPVVIELFTTQTCGMCPPADRLLGELASDPRVIALSLPVDLWDFMGWKDPLADPVHTTRHKAYNARLRQRSAYTPQMILDGVSFEPGARREQVLHAIDWLRATREDRVPVVAELDTDPPENAQVIRIRIAEAPEALDRPAQIAASVYALAYRSHHGVKVQGGKNAGKVMDYANVVFSLENIGEWDGEALELTCPMPMDEHGPAEGVAVLLQSGAVGPMLGAANLVLAHTQP